MRLSEAAIERASWDAWFRRLSCHWELRDCSFMLRKFSARMEFNCFINKL